MSNPQERGWGPAGLAKTVRVPCAGIQLNVRAEVAPLFAALVTRLGAARKAHGLSPLTSSGGYNFRPIRGYEAKYAATKNPDYLSNHSWGLAADFNAGTNPMGSPLRTDMPPETKAIAAALGFTHGAEWQRPDPQHMEFLGTPADAARLVADLANESQEDDDMTPAQDAALAKLFALFDTGRGKQALDRILGALNAEPSTALNDLDGAFIVKKLDQVLLGQDQMRRDIDALKAKP